MDRPLPYVNTERHWRRTIEGIDPDLFSIVTTTNRTESDLTGPGRMMGKWISKGGRRIERIIGVLATKMGFGPLEIAAKAIYPLNCLFYRCSRSHAGFSDAIGTAMTYYGTGYKALFSTEERCIFYCSQCHLLRVQRVLEIPQFEKSVRNLLKMCQAPDVSTEIDAVEEICSLAAFHSEFRARMICLGVHFTLHTLHNSLRLSTSQQYMTLKRAIMVALEVLDDDHMPQIFEELFGLDESIVEVERARVAFCAAEVTRSSSGHMSLSALHRIQQRIWHYPKDYKVYTGLTSCFPSRTMLASLLRRMQEAPPSSVEHRWIQSFFNNLMLWLSTGANERHLDYWIISASDLWVTLIELRLLCDGFQRFTRMHTRLISESELYRSSLLPLPSTIDSDYLWEGRFLCSALRPSTGNPWFPTFSEIVWAVLFEHEGFLEEPLVAWTMHLVDAIKASTA